MVSVVWLSILVGCSAAPASPEQRAAGERRLLQPFLSGAEVTCSELVVDATANFHTHIAQPALDPRAHTASRARIGSGTEWVWTNRTGDPLTGFVVRIGAVADPTEVGAQPLPGTTFRVANRFTLRLHEDHRPLQLEAAATAGGRPVQVRLPGGARSEAGAYTIRDGVVGGR